MKGIATYNFFLQNVKLEFKVYGFGTLDLKSCWDLDK